MLKAVIFDLGGVIVRSHERRGRRHWEQKLGLPDWGCDEIVFNSSMGVKAQLGEISETALWRWVGERLKLSAAELDAFQQDFWADDVVDLALVAYLHSLRAPYQVALISNAADGLRQALADRYNIADLFDLIVISAEEKVMKPTAVIYERTLAQLDRRPEETVFVDDNAANIAAARALGMAAIHFTPAVDIPAEMAALGVMARNGI
jgi:glucose-1-phosphatase